MKENNYTDDHLDKDLRVVQNHLNISKWEDAKEKMDEVKTSMGDRQWNDGIPNPKGEND